MRLGNSDSKFGQFSIQLHLSLAKIPALLIGSFLAKSLFVP
jgi:hypothetical protein